jgi:UDP-2-acetamido-3-amino-2,3-dideoxy-glucuronate N-acetyltransferase
MNYFAHETAVIDEGCQIGAGSKIWHFSHLMSGCSLGEGCNIGQNVVISPDVVLGKNVKVQNNVSIYTGVSCADDVFLGPSCVFTNVLNPRSAVNRRGAYLETHVGKGASIGANATIVCGHNIGAYAFIGAGAVVPMRWSWETLLGKLAGCLHLGIAWPLMPMVRPFAQNLKKFIS